MLWVEKQAAKILWAVIAFIMMGGCVYSLYLGDALRFYDEKEYYLIATNLVEKGFFTINGSDPSAWRPPGYPLFQAVFIFLGGKIFTLRMMNFVLLSLCVWIIYTLLEKTSKMAAICGVLLMLWYPLFFFTASTLYPQTFTMALFLATLPLLFQKKLSYKSAFAIGVLYGIATLSVVTMIGSLGITVIWLLFSRKESWKNTIVIILGCFLVLAPWTLRNYLVFDSFVFVANNGGIAFVLGNSPETEPNTGGNIALPSLEGVLVKNEVDIDHYYKKTAIHYMLTHKWESLKMYFLKFLNNFNFTNDLMTKSEMSFFRDFVLFVTYYTLLILAIIRLIMRKWSKEETYLVWLYLGQALLLAFFITRIRYRLPYDPILILLGAPILARVKRPRDAAVPDSQYR